MELVGVGRARGVEFGRGFRWDGRVRHLRLFSTFHVEEASARNLRGSTPQEMTPLL